MEDGKTRGRFARYPGGAVPQSTRTPEEQLKHLDLYGFVATKERAKLFKRIEDKKAKEQKAKVKSEKKDSK